MTVPSLLEQAGYTTGVPSPERPFQRSPPVRCARRRNPLVRRDMLASFAALTRRELPEAAGPDSFNVLPALRGAKAGRNQLVEQGGARNWHCVKARGRSFKLLIERRASEMTVRTQSDTIPAAARPGPMSRPPRGNGRRNESINAWSRPCNYFDSWHMPEVCTCQFSFGGGRAMLRRVNLAGFAPLRIRHPDGAGVEPGARFLRRTASADVDSALEDGGQCAACLRGGVFPGVRGQPGGQ